MLNYKFKSAKMRWQKIFSDPCRLLYFYGGCFYCKNRPIGNMELKYLCWKRIFLYVYFTVDWIFLEHLFASSVHIFSFFLFQSHLWTFAIIFCKKCLETKIRAKKRTHSYTCIFEGENSTKSIKVMCQSSLDDSMAVRHPLQVYANEHCFRLYALWNP